MATLAQVCLWSVGFSELADAINSDKDPHCIIGANLIGSSYESFYKRYKDGDKVAKSLRQAGKAGNFGFPGMMGAAKFVIAQKKAGYSVCEWFFADGKCKEQKRLFEWRDEPLDMPLCSRCVEQAGVIREGYLQQWKEVPRYWNWVMKEIQNNDEIVQFVSKRVRGSPHGPAAANTLFQGLAADGAKRALIQMTKEMYLDRDSALFGSRLLIFAHDETIIEIPEEKMHDAAMRQAAVMVSKMRECVPDVKVSAVPALMRRWYKEAEAVYDENGRLVPWEPTQKAA
jgi:DNA polymerase I